MNTVAWQCCKTPHVRESLLWRGIAIAYNFRLHATVHHINSRVVLTPGRLIYKYAANYAWISFWCAFRSSDYKCRTGQLSGSEYNVHFKSFPYWGNVETEYQNDMANTLKRRKRLKQLPRYCFLFWYRRSGKTLQYTLTNTQNSCQRHVCHTFSNVTQEKWQKISLNKARCNPENRIRAVVSSKKKRWPPDYNIRYVNYSLYL
jgi:hypothetical protein